MIQACDYDSCPRAPLTLCMQLTSCPLLLTFDTYLGKLSTMLGTHQLGVGAYERCKSVLVEVLPQHNAYQELHNVNLARTLWAQIEWAWPPHVSLPVLVAGPVSKGHVHVLLLEASMIFWLNPFNFTTHSLSLCNCHSPPSCCLPSTACAASYPPLLQVALFCLCPPHTFSPTPRLPTLLSHYFIPPTCVSATRARMRAPNASPSRCNASSSVSPSAGPASALEEARPAHK